MFGPAASRWVDITNLFTDVIFNSFSYLTFYLLRKIKNTQAHCSLINQCRSGRRELAQKEILQALRISLEKLLFRLIDLMSSAKLCDVLQVYFKLKFKNEIKQEKQYLVN